MRFEDVEEECVSLAYQKRGGRVVRVDIDHRELLKNLRAKAAGRGNDAN